ncbi:MAG: phosphopantothenoylcysteine decarboxylase, partial [Armatimonadetes bacterium]|nr:phosphopantothenoylcysteine decarboxylase [Candidatus Hippobium faecium]
MNLKDKNIILCVSGSIAAYKACDIASRLVKKGASVHVLMTENAKKFVAPLTFSSLTGNNVCDMWEDHEYKIGHIALAKLADLVIVAPATANIIAKFAHGIADDLLTATVLATKAPVVIAPAMNTGMLENSVTLKNIEFLKSVG